MVNYKTISSNPSLPKVDVVVIVSRKNTNPKWVDQCLNSIIGQTYGNLGLLEVENNNNFLSIGRAWNMAADASKADYLYFVGDDDIIHPVTVAVCVEMHTHFKKAIKGKTLALTTTGVTLINENTEILGYAPCTTTGLIPRIVFDKRKKLRFSETLANGVDDDWLARIKKKTKYQAMKVEAFFGYYYRTHAGQVSGQKKVIKR